jgi:hypothetical protein
MNPRDFRKAAPYLGALLLTLRLYSSNCLERLSEKGVSGSDSLL